MPNEIIRIESREHLLSTLSEASELEHNLMCLYLYAYFSLKQEGDPSLNDQEMSAVLSWGKIIKEIAIQEMGHLAMVANITTSIGGAAHFHRPNFPVSPGYYPSEFVVQLSPFNLASLDHFIFLERPDDSEIDMSQEFAPEVDYNREAPGGRLMSHTGDYKTVGALYEAINHGLHHLVSAISEEELFCGHRSLQITPSEVKLPGLVFIKDLKSARDAINTIVEQGEGGRSKDSHFQKFLGIKEEYMSLLKLNPEFHPSRACARNPVMRKPAADSEAVVWVSHPTAAQFLDVGNALYGLMLRLLVQIYSMEGRENHEKKFLLNCAFKVMESMSVVSRILPSFPAHDDSEEMAGLSFSLNRHFSAYEISSEKRLISERVSEILKRVRVLMKLGSFVKELASVQVALEHIMKDIPKKLND